MPLTRRGFLLGAAVVAASAALTNVAFPPEVARARESLADATIETAPVDPKSLPGPSGQDILDQLLGMGRPPLPRALVELQREGIGVYARFEIEALTVESIMEWRERV